MVTAINNILTTVGEENQTTPLIFDSPHSGNTYPKDFFHITTFEKLRQAEDSYVDELYSDVSKLGAVLLKANYLKYKWVLTIPCDVPFFPIDFFLKA